jgi:[NiFe] hydrogenase diaphorase moiety small subunit
MFCERSGFCELQALAYRLGITAPRHPYFFPQRGLDMSHPDVFLDRNRCILCGRCVRVSQTLDKKNVFQFIGRGHKKRLQVNAVNLAATDLAGSDKVVEACPVGALRRKHVGYATPIGQRPYDKAPIGSEIEQAGGGQKGA